MLRFCRLKIVFILFCILGVQSFARSPLFCESYFGRKTFLLKPLPLKESEEFLQLRDSISEMLLNPNKSHLVLDFQSYFEKGYGRYFYEHFEKEYIGIYKSADRKYERHLRRFMLDESDKLTEDIKNTLNFIFELLREATAHAVKNYKLSVLSVVDFRYLSQKKGNSLMPAWHLDAYVINAIFHIEGTGVEYAPEVFWTQEDYLNNSASAEATRDFENTQNLQPFQLLIFNGLSFGGSLQQKIFAENSRYLVHRTTGRQEDRLTVIMRLIDEDSLSGD